jgi:hypothetical protein
MTGWSVCDLIALDDQNLLEIIGQHARRDQTGNATANNNRLFSGPVAHGTGRRESDSGSTLDTMPWAL